VGDLESGVIQSLFFFRFSKRHHVACKESIVTMRIEVLCVKHTVCQLSKGENAPQKSFSSLFMKEFYPQKEEGVIKKLRVYSMDPVFFKSEM